MEKFIKKENVLEAEFIFKDFQEAFGFMTRVAFLAEQQGHHPDWTNVWNRVQIKLCTHDAGNVVTEKDYALAEAIEKIWNKND